MSNYLKSGKVREIFLAILDGKGIRETARDMAVSSNTVLRYADTLRWLTRHGYDEFSIPESCLCGQMWGHRGWCSYRYAKSVRRQKFMKEWHQKRRP